VIATAAEAFATGDAREPTVVDVREGRGEEESGIRPVEPDRADGRLAALLAGGLTLPGTAEILQRCVDPRFVDGRERAGVRPSAGAGERSPSAVCGGPACSVLLLSPA
jgi:hypothetical protein